MANDGAYDPISHVRSSLEESARVKRAVAKADSERIAQVAQTLADAFRAGRKALLFGNGGSASDAQHIAAEWTGRFSKDRAALPAIALTSNTSELTALGNDYGFERVFARLIEAHGQEGDVVFAISTSGNSPNVLEAVREARARRMVTVALSGKGGGKLADCVDVALVVPSNETQRIQESHIAICHCICEVVDALLFPELRPA